MKIGIAVDAGEPSEVELVARDVKIKDRVVADRLGEHESVVAAGAGQHVVAGEREDRRTWRIGFDIVGNDRSTDGAVRIGPSLGDLEQRRSGKAGGRQDAQRCDIVCLHAPSAVAVAAARVQAPIRRQAGDRQTRFARMVRQRQIDRRTGDTCRSDASVREDKIGAGEICRGEIVENDFDD